VEDILAFARVDAGELSLDLSPQSVRELLELSCEAATVTAERRHVTLECTAIDERAICDRDRVLQILSNLLGNALKFTPPGGKVSVRAERLGAVIGFEVRDTGPGISRDLSERIFERYYTRDNKRGAGLGLHIARMLVHAQHGEIGVDSEPGRGSTFWFTLPAADAAANVPDSKPTGVDLRISAAKRDPAAARMDELDRLTTSV
jgi:signal transduction histidine kinase